MEKIRKGKDLKLLWPILTNGEPLPLEGRLLTLELRNRFGGIVPLKWSSSGNILSAEVPAGLLRLNGKYIATLYENRGRPGQTAVDAIAFELVNYTFEEEQEPDGNLIIESVELLTADIGRDQLDEAIFSGEQLPSFEDTDEILLRRGTSLKKISAADLRLWCNYGLTNKIGTI